MSDRPHVVLHLGLQCRESGGPDLIAFLHDAVPIYKGIVGVNVGLLRSKDKPGRFIEIIEYDTEEVV